MLDIKTKKHLILFGTENYKIAIDSLVESSMDYFDYKHVFNTQDIDNEFYQKNIEILKQTRGAGYWLWKPYFINKVLSEVNDGDIVFYVDAGNVFLCDPSFIYENFDVNNGIILFDNRDGMKNGQSAQNFISCKKDSFVLMDCDNDEFVNGIHLNGSYQIYFKNDHSLKFVNEYLNYCQNINIITDTPNNHGENYNGYYEHRHDQSILSLLAIKYKIKSLVDPSEWGNKSTERGFNQIFLHHRNKNYKK
jgi:hypothetical protein